MSGPVPIVIVQTTRYPETDLATGLEASGQIIVVREMYDVTSAAKAASTRSARVVLLVAEDAQAPALVTSLMHYVRVPVVVIARSTAGVVAAMAAGAVEGLPTGTPLPRLVESLKLMSEVRVVRRFSTGSRLAPREEPSPGSIPPTPEPAAEERRLVAIGASTGGPAALIELLTPLPRDFPAAIVIAQHMPNDYDEAFARWLSEVTNLDAKVSTDGEPARPGQVYIPRGGCDLVIHPSGTLENAAPTGRRPVPSVDRLLESAARLRQYSLFGVVLSGMGRDGMVGLKAMRLAGALTLVQDSGSCAVESMPASAVEHGGADFALPPQHIAQQLLAWAGG